MESSSQKEEKRIYSEKISMRRKSLFQINDNLKTKDDDLGLIIPLGNEDINLSNKIDFANSTILSTPKNKKCEEFEDFSPLFVSPLNEKDLVLTPTDVHKTHYFNGNTALSESSHEEMKTPHDTSTTNATLPKLIRKSESNSKFDDITSRSNDGKNEESSTKSKVRTALFTDKEVALPVNSFYPKINTTILNSRLHVNSRYNAKQTHKRKDTFLCNRYSKRKNYGLINAGVRHGIKKPKTKKLNKSQLLNAALDIINNSKLNDILETEKLNISNEQLVDSNKYEEEKLSPKEKFFEYKLLENDHQNHGIKRIRSPSPDNNKKFFKTSRMKGTFTIRKGMKVEVEKGKLSYINSNLNLKNKRKIEFEMIDLGSDNETSINIDGILSVLDNSKENIDKNTNSMENSNSSYNINITTSNFNSRCSINDNLSLDVTANFQNRSSDQLTDISNNLLSPTSQMCSMTSDLAIHSPKKSAINISNILEGKTNLSRSVDNPSVSSTDNMEEKKLFPIFYPSKRIEKIHNNLKNEKTCKRFKPLQDDQYFLDVGQKKFGVTQCSVCNFVYHMGDPSEEEMHFKYHSSSNVLKFHGWKNENVLSVVQDDRIIRVIPSDPKIWWKKVTDLMEVVNRDLGYFTMELNMKNTQVYLYIKEKVIAGCLVAEPKCLAHKMCLSKEIDLCSEEVYPIKCGISRLWVSKDFQKKGIGTALLDCLRSHFISNCNLSKNEIAMSSPTEAGKEFAKKYFETSNFLVYIS